LSHFRTTVNRRTFVGRAGRTNDERVWVVVVFDVCEEVVTKHPAKSVEPSSYIDEPSTNPVVVVVWEIGKAVPVVVMINCCGCWKDELDGAVVRRNVVCRWGLVVVAIRRI
jgi:hypothetical protein